MLKANTIIGALIPCVFLHAFAADVAANAANVVSKVVGSSIKDRNLLTYASISMAILHRRE